MPFIFPIDEAFGLNNALLCPGVSHVGSVLAVIVLYKRSIAEVPCQHLLKRWLDNADISSTQLHLNKCLIYDNSPVMQPIDTGWSKCVESYHDSSNGGTRAAYLFALKVARMNGLSWILFLDHDTDLPEDFFDAAERAISCCLPDKYVCAVVPHVVDGLFSISPSEMTSYGRVACMTGRNAATVGGVDLTAIASASLVRTEALESILPIPSIFSLDYLDHWLFRELRRKGGQLIVSNARVQHSLSVQSMSTISADRYKYILAAELEFLRGGEEYSKILHFFWHMGRVIKLVFLTRRTDLVMICLRAAVNIIRSK